jgi:hypothetical protein
LSKGPNVTAYVVTEDLNVLKADHAWQECPYIVQDFLRHLNHRRG